MKWEFYAQPIGDHEPDGHGWEPFAAGFARVDGIGSPQCAFFWRRRLGLCESKAHGVGCSLEDGHEREHYYPGMTLSSVEDLGVVLRKAERAQRDADAIVMRIVHLLPNVFRGKRPDVRFAVDTVCKLLEDPIKVAEQLRHAATEHANVVGMATEILCELFGQSSKLEDGSEWSLMSAARMVITQVEEWRCREKKAVRELRDAIGDRTDGEWSLERAVRAVTVQFEPPETVEFKATCALCRQTKYECKCCRDRRGELCNERMCGELGTETRYGFRYCFEHAPEGAELIGS